MKNMKPIGILTICLGAFMLYEVLKSPDLLFACAFGAGALVGTGLRLLLRG